MDRLKKTEQTKHGGWLEQEAGSFDDVGFLFKGNMHRLHLLALESSRGHCETLEDVRMRQRAEKKINRKAAIFVPANTNAERKTGEGKPQGET